MNLLVAMFDNYSEAIDARNRLDEIGIPADQARITTAEMDTIGTTEKKHHHGFFATLKEIFGMHEDTGTYAEAIRRGSVVLTVPVSNDTLMVKARKVLEDAGAVDVDQRVEAWKATGYTAYDETAKCYDQKQVAKERDTFKVVQEEVKVGKRQVAGDRVRVVSRVTETPVVENVTLREEKAVIERRPVDRAATTEEMATLGAQEKDVVIRETAEEAVVSKTARVVEEVVVGKKASERTETVRDTVRRTDVDVDVEKTTGKTTDCAPNRMGKQQPARPNKSAPI